MSNIQNISGSAGEFFCGTELMRPVAGNRFLFDAVLLGAKEPTYDYLVFLLDSNADRCGPFFFLQVKTTTKAPTPSGAYAFDFNATDVRRAQAMKVPFFVCIVDRTTTRAERIFVMGVDSKRRTGIARLQPRYDLATDPVKIGIFDEVQRQWQSQTVPASTAFI